MLDDTIRSMDLKYLPYRGWRFIAYADGQLVAHLVGIHDSTWPLFSYLLHSVNIAQALDDMVSMMGDSLAVVACRACVDCLLPHEGGTLARVR